VLDSRRHLLASEQTQGDDGGDALRQLLERVDVAEPDSVVERLSGQRLPAGVCRVVDSSGQRLPVAERLSPAGRQGRELDEPFAVDSRVAVQQPPQVRRDR
jgi:hypothetical protein